MRQVTDAERRVRLGVRHSLAPSARVDSADAAAAAVVALHATEAASVYLSCWARMKSVCVADIDRALYEDRSLIKQLAMRRTLFAFPRDLLPAVWSSASARVADIERTRIIRGVERAGLAADGQAWLQRARTDVLAALADIPSGRTAQEIRQAVPRIDVPVALVAGSTRAATAVLTQLGAAGEIVRGANVGHWRTSRPLLTLMHHWIVDLGEPTSAEEGYRELVRRWLYRFGPGTVEDMVWWLGSTKATVRKALIALEAVEVALCGGSIGWLLPDDLDKLDDPGTWVALLPVLDPTVMGWRHREFYLGPHRSQLFDTRGNAGATAWVDGRVVGGWVQDESGEVHVRLLEPVARRAQRALGAEAARLTSWLAGVRIGANVQAPVATEPSIRQQHPGKQ
ncbi:winged helix DNA-binding domain-containing protein [Mycobacterium deserti]|uniref:Winged helix DNA-binding domain-containing protein n=1 Tax=Mycobacterium deserti TaxID=2978347 RepID=A0ABT2M6W2_9MYCO|nr:winged helix DNA-binding domain-containing protein [Mycobacterium deserti]MCT7657997.1 winged helix DNA-binding domain-containing protein [Mycobacterium deserti]